MRGFFTLIAAVGLLYMDFWGTLTWLAAGWALLLLGVVVETLLWSWRFGR